MSHVFSRSLHDALCVIRCLVKKRALIAGGGVPEIEVTLKLMEHAQKLSGMDAYCFRAFADAMEVIPYTLAENAGLNPIETVTELRNRHANGEINAGINVRYVTTLFDMIFFENLNMVRPMLKRKHVHKEVLMLSNVN